jgi:primosomal protein DnaI
MATLFKASKLRENSLQSNYISALKDDNFKKLISHLKVSEEELKQNTTKLQDTLNELKDCQNCPGIFNCPHQMKGCVNYPEVYHDHLTFAYITCKYKKEQLKKSQSKVTEDQLINAAQMKDIDITDKNRVKLIKWLNNFIKKYDSSKSNKGLYLHGNFGCGKTYLISAMFNELKKQNITSEVVYLPTLLRDLKANFDTLDETINYLETVELLLIDDIGAEHVTEWSRDEILGTILQSRMSNHKTTFFTSNFNISELETHLSNNGQEPIKARRIVERIKQLTEDLEMISENRRK